MERYFYLSLFVTTFCLHAMENTKKGLVEHAKHLVEKQISLYKSFGS